MPKDTTGRGELSELEIATALARAGKAILRPLSASLRYDLAIDNGDGTISRVQCKTGILRDGCVEFRVANSDARRPNGVRYVGQIEAFAVFCPQNRRVYLVPMADVATHAFTARLRLEPARNNQLRRVRMAAPYEVGAH